MREKVSVRGRPGCTEIFANGWRKPTGQNLFGGSAGARSPLIPANAHGQCRLHIDRGYPSFGSITALILHAKTN